MALSPEYRSFMEELVAPLGPVRIRNMFGGTGIFYGKLMFAMIFDETLYMRVDERNRPDYDAEGMEPFVYETQSGKLIEFTYVELPSRLLDDPEEFRLWARKAIDAAIVAKRPKAKPSAGRAKPSPKKPRRKAAKRKGAR
ncbi:MAG TPA: TfoX/Sxy family protein [Candidatus Cybelea sp.]|nr:TfoX/Sxy family protein [Candidatus Cybelea sp.]